MKNKGKENDNEDDIQNIFHFLIFRWCMLFSCVLFYFSIIHCLNKLWCVLKTFQFKFIHLHSSSCMTFLKERKKQRKGSKQQTGWWILVYTYMMVMKVKFVSFLSNIFKFSGFRVNYWFFRYLNLKVRKFIFRNIVCMYVCMRVNTVEAAISIRLIPNLVHRDTSIVKSSKLCGSYKAGMIFLRIFVILIKVVISIQLSVWAIWIL